jgi:hypothetical protein
LVSEAITSEAVSELLAKQSLTCEAVIASLTASLVIASLGWLVPCEATPSEAVASLLFWWLLRYHQKENGATHPPKGCFATGQLLASLQKENVITCFASKKAKNEVKIKGKVAPAPLVCP